MDRRSPRARRNPWHRRSTRRWSTWRRRGPAQPMTLVDLGSLWGRSGVDAWGVGAGPPGEGAWGRIRGPRSAVGRCPGRTMSRDMGTIRGRCPGWMCGGARAELETILGRSGGRRSVDAWPNWGQSGADPRPIWGRSEVRARPKAALGRAGVLGSIPDRSGVDLGSTLVQSGVDLGSILVRPWVDLGSNSRRPKHAVRSVLERDAAALDPSAAGAASPPRPRACPKRAPSRRATPSCKGDPGRRAARGKPTLGGGGAPPRGERVRAHASSLARRWATLRHAPAGLASLPRRRCA